MNCITLTPQTVEPSVLDLYDTLEVVYEFEARANENFIKNYLLIKSAFISAN